MRPKKCRKIGCSITGGYFKPRGIPMKDLEVVELLPDELEAFRLADYQGLYHEEAAKLMDVSRQTFGRILASARKKVAETIVIGKALKIEQSVTEE